MKLKTYELKPDSVYEYFGSSYMYSSFFLPEGVYAVGDFEAKMMCRARLNRDYRLVPDAVVAPFVPIEVRAKPRSGRSPGGYLVVFDTPSGHRAIGYLPYEELLREIRRKLPIYRPRLFESIFYPLFFLLRVYAGD